MKRNLLVAMLLCGLSLLGCAKGQTIDQEVSTEMQEEVIEVIEEPKEEQKEVTIYSVLEDSFHFENSSMYDWDDETKTIYYYVNVELNPYKGTEESMMEKYEAIKYGANKKLEENGLEADIKIICIGKYAGVIVSQYGDIEPLTQEEKDKAWTEARETSFQERERIRLEAKERREQEEKAKQQPKEKTYIEIMSEALGKEIEVGLTYENFVMINEVGFSSLESINELFGFDGELVFDGANIKTYQWTDNRNFIVVTISFDKYGQVGTKSQVGLK